MRITTITAVFRTEPNTDDRGAVCGATSWWEYTLPPEPGAEPETVFMSEAWCLLRDVYGLSIQQASDALSLVRDFGRIDLAA